MSGNSKYCFLQVMWKMVLAALLDFVVSLLPAAFSKCSFQLVTFWFLEIEAKWSSLEGSPAGMNTNYSIYLLLRSFFATLNPNLNDF